LIEIAFIIAGAFATNIYFLIDNEKKETIIVDPAGFGDEIDDFLKEKELSVKMVLITHGHPDHVEALKHLKNKYHMPVYINPEDAAMFAVKYDHSLNNGDIIEFGGDNLKIISTPGHTMGSVCIQGNNFLLTGDTIFEGSIGRTDIGGDIDIMMDTLTNCFKDIPDETALFPGHGSPTTMRKEKDENMYIIAARQREKELSKSSLEEI
jgi:glyoxylase-like metal-dependent hydrolase (beta-lactamase superfamily II)